MNRVSILLAAALLGGCGDEGGSQAEKAASACDAYAKNQLGDKTYSLDTAALAQSLTANADGTQLLKGPIVIEPGLAGESKQTLECAVRFEPGQEAPSVIRMQFIW